MNLKKSLLATLSVAMLAFSANAEIIHESDFEAEPATGFGIGSETMGFTDAGGDLIGFSANNNTLTSGDALGISDANPNSGSFHYAVDAGATTSTGGTPRALETVGVEVGMGKTPKAVLVVSLLRQRQLPKAMVVTLISLQAQHLL